jgi:hypothetical protein
MPASPEPMKPAQIFVRNVGFMDSGPALAGIPE